MSSSILQRLASFFGKNAATAAAESSCSSRSVARERLSVILASQRGSQLLNGVDMDAFQRDVMDVVKKHIKEAKRDPVSFQVKQEGEINLFEMQVEIYPTREGRKDSISHELQR